MGWRPGAAKRIVVNFSNSYPHDCDLNEGVPGTSGPWSTGRDPGRDAIMGTSDDLDLQSVLSGMQSYGVTLLDCQADGVYLDHWERWATITGGDAFAITAADFTNVVIGAITANLSGIDLQVTAFDVGSTSDWIQFTRLGANTFRETITVPSDAAPGDYTFTVNALDESGRPYGEQALAIKVRGEPNPPSIPGLTDWGIAAMIGAITICGLLLLRRRFAREPI